MSNIRKMIDAISSEDFNGAKGALKASLAEYMAGRKYVSNKDLFGDKYSNPNDEESEMKAELTESIDVGEMADELLDFYDNASSKISQEIWEIIEDATSDSGIYAGDATPDELIRYLVNSKPRVIKSIYSKYLVGE